MKEKPEKGKKKKRSKENDEDLDEDILPETGLNTPDGFLFYHTQPIKLTQYQKQRVKEHGINLNAERSFSLEESVLIFQNWKEFAEEHKLKLTKASEYVNAKKSDKFLIIHQKENHFWPKLCSGLPHRACHSVKIRASAMMTDAFLKDLNWENPVPQITEKYYTYSKFDELVWAKMKTLTDKGYSVSHAADILDISANRARGISTRLNKLEERDDPAMMQMVFETACTSGLDADRIPRLLSSGDEERYYRKTLKHVNFEEMSLKVHLSQEQCKKFLKEKILKRMWKKYRKLVDDEEKNEEEAIVETMRIISPKKALTNEQELRALEILCQNVGKYDVLVDLRGKEELAEIFRNNGITGFQCPGPEIDRLYTLFYRATKSLNIRLFDNLRRDFRYQLKIHCALWGWKKLDVWKNLPVKKDETRYETVLRHELSSPFVSELTKRFLKSKQVAKWIKERSSMMMPQQKDHRASVNFLAIEAFILFAHTKFKGKFVFPAKLRHLIIPGASETVQNILNLTDDSEDNNSEFLTRKEVKNALESAADVKVGVKLRKKSFFVKKQLEENSESGEEEEDVENDGDEDFEEKIKEAKRKRVEEMKRKIEETVGKADPDKRKKKFRDMDEEGTDKGIKLREDVMGLKKVLTKAAKCEKVRLANKTSCSKEVISSSDSDSDDDDNANQIKSSPDDSEGLDDFKRDPDAPSASEDVRSSRNEEVQKKRKRIVDSDCSDAPEDPEGSEDVPPTSEFQSEAVEEQNNLNSEDSEDVRKKKKKKEKRRRQTSEDVTVNDKQKRRRQDSAATEDSEGVPGDFDVPDDSEDVGKKKKKEKRRRQNLEDSEVVPEVFDASDDPEDVGKKKKAKKRRRQNSEDVEAPEASESPKKSKKKKRRRQNSEDME